MRIAIETCLVSLLPLLLNLSLLTFLILCIHASLPCTAVFFLWMFFVSLSPALEPLS
jgi:hypothetical protein